MTGRHVGAGRPHWAGRRILVVEDDYWIATETQRAMEAAGAVVVGPVATISGALDLLGRTPELDGAVLDINLGGELCFPVADAVIARGVPLVFATGYDAGIIPKRYGQVVRCEKPFALDQLAAALFG